MQAILDHWSFDRSPGQPQLLLGEEIALVTHPTTGLSMLVIVPDYDGTSGALTLQDPVRDVVLVTCGNLIAITAELGGRVVRSGPHSCDRVTFVPAGTSLVLHHQRDASLIAALILPAGRLAAMIPGRAAPLAPFALHSDAWLAAHAMQMGRHVLRGCEQETALIEGMTAALAAGLTDCQIMTQPLSDTRIMLPPRKLRSVLAYIDDNLARPISLRDMADHASLSPFHFGRAFKQATGRSPYDHVFRRRIVRSTALVARSELKIAEIAALTGFANAAHFSQAFQREAGVSPSRFRAVIKPRLLDHRSFKLLRKS